MYSLKVVLALTPMVLALPQPLEVSSNTPEKHEVFPRSDGTTEHRLRYRGLDAENPEHVHQVTVVKRDEQHTDFTFGNSKLYYGCDVDPVKEIDHLSDMCIHASCDSTQVYSRDIDYLDISKGGNPGAPSRKKLQLKALGEFPTPLRNGLVAAMQTAAGADGLINWHRKVDWAQGGNDIGHGVSTPTLRGTCDIAEFTNYINISVRDPEDKEIAWIQATFSIAGGNNLSGFCKALGISAAIAGAFPVVGGVVGGFLGAVKGTCS